MLKLLWKPYENQETAAALLLPLLVLLVSCSRDPKSLVATGNKYFDRGKYKEASIMYRRALQKDRKSADAWYRLGLVDSKLGAYGRGFVGLPEGRRAESREHRCHRRNWPTCILPATSSIERTRRRASPKPRTRQTLAEADPKFVRWASAGGLCGAGGEQTRGGDEEFRSGKSVRPWQPAVVLTLCELLCGRHRAPRRRRWPGT